MKAVIFDMDGVISDTQSVYARAESHVFAEHGVVITPEEISRRFGGRTSPGVLRELFPDLSDDERDVIAQKRHARISGALDVGIAPIPETIAVITMLANAKVPLAVASATRPHGIERILRALAVRDAFAHIVSAQDVPRGKPEPDIFLRAAELLGVAPSECIVIEDSPQGMEAARRAGMYCVGLVRSGNCDGLPAHVVVDDARKVNWKALLHIP